MVDVELKYLNENPRVATIYLTSAPDEARAGNNAGYVVSEISGDFKRLFTCHACELKGRRISDILSDPFSNYDYYHVISAAFSMGGPDTTDFYSQLSGKKYVIAKNRRDNKDIIITIVMIETQVSKKAYENCYRDKMNGFVAGFFELAGLTYKSESGSRREGKKRIKFSTLASKTI